MRSTCGEITRTYTIWGIFNPVRAVHTDILCIFWSAQRISAPLLLRIYSAIRNSRLPSTRGPCLLPHLHTIKEKNKFRRPPGIIQLGNYRTGEIISKTGPRTIRALRTEPRKRKWLPKGHSEHVSRYSWTWGGGGGVMWGGWRRPREKARNWI